MSTMSNYCKAYPLYELRAYEEWRENLNASEDKPENMDGDDIVFIHENFIVTKGIYPNEEIIFSTVKESWKEYCTNQLNFNPVVYS
jgi:hypothetical protein